MTESTVLSNSYLTARVTYFIDYELPLSFDKTEMRYQAKLTAHTRGPRVALR